MNGNVICTIVLVASCSILISFTNGSNLREMEKVPFPTNFNVNVMMPEANPMPVLFGDNDDAEFRSKSDNTANENKVMKVAVNANGDCMGDCKQKIFSQRNNNIGSGGNNEQLVSFLSISEKIMLQKCGTKCKNRKRRQEHSRKQKQNAREKNDKGESKDDQDGTEDQGRACLTGRDKNTGTYEIGTEYYFPKESDCKDGDDRNGENDNCMKISVANHLSGKEDDKKSFPDNQRLVTFLDITNIKAGGGKSTYTYNCKDGKETGNSEWSQKEDGNYEFNGDVNSLCQLLNKNNVCNNFKERVFYGNGCSKNNCRGVDDQSRELNRRIKLRIFVEDGKMKYEVTHKGINGGRRRRLLHSGAAGCDVRI